MTTPMMFCLSLQFVLFFFFNDTATTEIYTLSLHDALPISGTARPTARRPRRSDGRARPRSRVRSEEHTSELQSHLNLVCRLLLEKKKHTSELQSHLNLVCRLLLEKKKHTSQQATSPYVVTH